MYTCIVLFRYDNVVFNDRERIHADRLQGTDEIQEKKQFSWEKSKRTLEVENINSEDFLAGRPAENCEFNRRKFQ